MKKNTTLGGHERALNWRGVSTTLSVHSRPRTLDQAPRNRSKHDEEMGKKAKKHDGAAATDSHPEPKKLSAHQQRYAERKQLKKQVIELKAQHDEVNSLQKSRRGLSKGEKLRTKADKYALKKQKKALSDSIRKVTLQANDKTLTHKAAPRAAAPCGNAAAADDDEWRSLWEREARALG